MCLRWIPDLTWKTRGVYVRRWRGGVKFWTRLMPCVKNEMVWVTRCPGSQTERMICFWCIKLICNNISGSEIETIRSERTARSMCSTQRTRIGTFKVTMKWPESRDLILYVKLGSRSDGTLKCSTNWSKSQQLFMTDHTPIDYKENPVN